MLIELNRGGELWWVIRKTGGRIAYLRYGIKQPGVSRLCTFGFVLKLEDGDCVPCTDAGVALLYRAKYGGAPSDVAYMETHESAMRLVLYMARAVHGSCSCWILTAAHGRAKLVRVYASIYNCGLHLGAGSMLITLESQRDWVYMLQRKIVPGRNYIAETMLKVGFGRPVAGPGCPIFDGYRIFSLHSVSYTGEWLYSGRDYTEGNTKLRIEDAESHAVESLLHKLETANPAGEFYSRGGLFGCTGVIIMTHERQYEWTIKPVLDERLWRRYVDSVNRTAADAVVR